ncbi:ArsA family ATPase [Geitlerinema sp. PCC 9228]|jgi:arsenite-transporting ATPase|uniref:Get3/ArsA fold putative tail anchor-mediating ATPase NosAFP n=1 Tax=Geitlerinema sp. PCC 9228 TaxID=111611 RepID=UPI0008F993B6|nr:ArsA family ATPase [Geitlerinema sp. PCC 9228]
MSQILTFLGKGGTGRTTIAIATAKKYAQQNQRVLLCSVDPSFHLLLGTTVSDKPTEIAPNLQAVKLQGTTLLEKSWEELKRLEAEYVKTPFFKDVYGQELAVLPGMENALILNALREYDASGQYDLIVFDGPGNQETLRTIGMPEIMGWYMRRFRQVIAESDLAKALSPFVQPVTNAVLNVNWSNSDRIDQPLNQITDQLEKGRNTITDAKRVAGFLVTNNDPAAIATARYLWGSSQQVGLTVGGVLCNQQTQVPAATSSQFDPLPVTALPQRQGDSWEELVQALPDLQQQAIQAPTPITIDTEQRQVRLFLPSFDKNQVKLTQYGPEVTIEAGDQRHNVFLPQQLRNKAVTGAKFQNQYLTISFAQ